MISFEKGENVKDLLIITKKPISKQKTVFVLKPDFIKTGQSYFSNNSSSIKKEKSVVQTN